jgi:hypothetical protein
VLGTSIVSFKQRGDGYKMRYLSINRAAQYTSQPVRVMSLVGHGVKESCDSERKEKEKRGPFQWIVTPGLYPIDPEPDAHPFQTVVMDFIVKLPTSNGYDAILTITDHDCTKGVILIPCRETMNTEELAKEYKN